MPDSSPDVKLPTDPIEALARRGVRLAIEAGGKTRASVDRPPGPELRAALTAAKPWLIAALAPPEPWGDPAEAVRLQITVDDLVERLGVSGAHPGIRAAAGLAVEAHHDRDLAGVRAACAAVEAMAGCLSRGASV